MSEENFLLSALGRAIASAREVQPTADQSWCDLRQHILCSGYTEDETDPESCFCECHDPDGAP